MSWDGTSTSQPLRGQGQPAQPQQAQGFRPQPFLHLENGRGSCLVPLGTDTLPEGDPPQGAPACVRSGEGTGRPRLPTRPRQSPPHSQAPSPAPLTPLQPSSQPSSLASARRAGAGLRLHHPGPHSQQLPGQLPLGTQPGTRSDHPILRGGCVRVPGCLAVARRRQLCTGQHRRPHFKGQSCPSDCLGWQTRPLSPLSARPSSGAGTGSREKAALGPEFRRRFRQLTQPLPFGAAETPTPRRRQPGSSQTSDS